MRGGSRALQRKAETSIPPLDREAPAAPMAGVLRGGNRALQRPDRYAAVVAAVFPYPKRPSARSRSRIQPSRHQAWLSWRTLPIASSRLSHTSMWSGSVGLPSVAVSSSS